MVINGECKGKLGVLGGTSVGYDLTMFYRTPNWLEHWYENNAITTCYWV